MTGVLCGSTFVLFCLFSFMPVESFASQWSRRGSNIVAESQSVGIRSPMLHDPSFDFDNGSDPEPGYNESEASGLTRWRRSDPLPRQSSSCGAIAEQAEGEDKGVHKCDQRRAFCRSKMRRIRRMSHFGSDFNETDMAEVEASAKQVGYQEELIENISRAEVLELVRMAETVEVPRCYACGELLDYSTEMKNFKLWNCPTGNLVVFRGSLAHRLYTEGHSPTESDPSSLPHVFHRDCLVEAIQSSFSDSEDSLDTLSARSRWVIEEYSEMDLPPCSDGRFAENGNIGYIPMGAEEDGSLHSSSYTRACSSRGSSDRRSSSVSSGSTGAWTPTSAYSQGRVPRLLRSKPIPGQAHFELRPSKSNVRHYPTSLRKEAMYVSSETPYLQSLDQSGERGTSVTTRGARRICYFVGYWCLFGWLGALLC